MMSNIEDKTYLNKIEKTEKGNEGRCSPSPTFDSSKLKDSKSGNVDYENQSNLMKLTKKASVDILNWVENATDISQQNEYQSEVSSPDKNLSHSESESDRQKSLLIP